MITLEITSTDIRLMEVINGKVTRWASGPLEAGIFQEEAVSDPQALGAAVKQLMYSSGMKDKKVVASVGSLYSLSRMVIVPAPLEQPVTEEAVLAAAEAMMPLAAQELYLYWQAIAPGEGGQQVLVIGVLRDVIDGEVRALRTAGIDPHVLGLRTLALARAANRKDALVLNIENPSYDVIMVVNGVAEVLRTTAWQPADLSVEERAELLVSALNTTVTFYNSRHHGSPLGPATPLFITGHLSGESALIKQIQDDTEYPVEPLAPSLEYPEHMPVSQYAVNIGLALKETTAPRLPVSLSFSRKNLETPKNTGHMVFSIPDINLLPRIYKAWRPSARQIYAVLAIVAALSLIFPIYGATNAAMKETSLVRQKYSAVNMVLERRKLELSKREPLQQAVTRYNSLVAIKGGFVADLEAVRNVAAELGVRVEAITQTGSGISFNCQAPDYIVFRDFIKALEENGRFTTPIIPPEGYPYIKGGTITLKPK